MEVTLRNEFCELTMDEMQVVDGGADWDRVFAGTTVYLGATLAIATATGPLGVGAVATYYAICAASGAYIGYGLVS